MLIKQFIITITLVACTNLCLSQPVAISPSSRTTLPTTTTTTSMPSIENPTEFEATRETDEEDSWRCLKCYDQITEAQRLLYQYQNLKDQVSKHLKERASKEASINPGRPTRKPKKPTPPNHRNQKNNSTSSFTTRTIDGSLSRPDARENRTIVVSTLRVARSPPPPLNQLDDIMSLLDKDRNFSKYSVDPVLKKLKMQQETNHNSTCKAIRQLSACLSQISKDCHGDLQFHTMEVLTDQWDGKLECPKPDKRIFTNIGGSFRGGSWDEEKVPHPRPTKDEITRKMQNLLGRPSVPGVRLTPTLTTHGSQRFEALKQAGIIQQQEQQHHISGQKTSQFNNGFIDFGGVQVPYVGQMLLLIPCLAIAAMALLALINISICHSKEDTKN